MKKRILALLIITVCALMLASCGCEHEWAEASCLTPKTCTLCEQTEGEATGHAWQPADCINPETCSHCGEQRGAALGHEWQAATCENDEVCTLCQEVNTLAFGHSFGTWEGSDEAFMHICQTCGKEESMTPEAFFLQQLTGTWQAKLYFTGSSEELDPEHYITVHPDGTIDLILNPRLAYPEMAQLVMEKFSSFEYPATKISGWCISFWLKNEPWWEENMGPDVPKELGVFLAVEYMPDEEREWRIELVYNGYHDIWWFEEKIEE